jgi:hypothetical protein
VVNIFISTFVTNSAKPTAPSANFVTQTQSTSPTSFPNSPSDCSNGPAGC